MASEQKPTDTNIDEKKIDVISEPEPEPIPDYFSSPVDTCNVCKEKIKDMKKCFDIHGKKQCSIECFRKFRDYMLSVKKKEEVNKSVYININNFGTRAF
ncbi:MAG: hypothetical protein Edafosvirus23_10 [Edafosvirus sp.]|uniref:Uncharacterized protein n=1 Tax=Edafosvirus sp. TaxID=2487765 RepID=A0A3G4ZXE1_9VIRU|nr:MAG: hypothetical protein Edafosvirus23_10 [Edafosvirus sp.]